MMPSDEQQRQQRTETRSKRAKIITACAECRRKKTRCNGEQPCGNCLKSSVPCVYPASHGDDKRIGPSKAALEGIEERLKAIEEMLKTIIYAQLSLGNLDQNAVNKFLNPNSQLKHSVSSPPPTSINPGSSSYQQQQHHPYMTSSPKPSPSFVPNSNTPPTSNSTGTTIPSPPPSSSSLNQHYRSSPPTSTSSITSGSGRELRLPSIHSLSAPSTEHRAFPQLGPNYYYAQETATTPPPSTSSDNVDTIHHYHMDKKRKL